MNKNISSIVFAIAIVIASIVLGNSYLNRNKDKSIISVTGLGKVDFMSDLIVWEGVYSKESLKIIDAYNGLSDDKKVIKDYLMSKGIKEDEIVFEAVSTRKINERKYSSDGDYIGEEFKAYRLSQSVKVESNNVEKVESVSREITELLNKGVEFYSKAPRYYYTKLSDLKIQMISQATEDARIRAEKISENSGSELGDLISAKMGVFQILGQNSNEDYSWGGTYNTTSKAKTASITMKLKYDIND